MTQWIMVVAATTLSVVLICLALATPNWYLGDRQNAVDTADLTYDIYIAIVVMYYRCIMYHWRISLAHL